MGGSQPGMALLSTSRAVQGSLSRPVAAAGAWAPEVFATTHVAAKRQAATLLEDGTQAEVHRILERRGFKEDPREIERQPAESYAEANRWSATFRA